MMNESAEQAWKTLWDSSGSEQDTSSNDVEAHGSRNGEARSGGMANVISPMRSQLKIQCIICKEAIFVDNFSEHIDSCGRSNREAQEVMKSSLERILRNFTPLAQIKAQEPATEVSNDIHRVKSLRSGNISLDPNRRYQNVRRGRSRTLLSDSSEKKHDSSQETCGPWRMAEEMIALEPSPRFINTDVSLLLENSTFSCSLCSYTTFKKTRLQKHESMHRVRQSKVVQCFYCSQRYMSGSLAVHIREVHPGLEFRFRNFEGAEVTRLACTKCTYKCLLKVQLKNHMKRKHSAKTTDSPKKIIRKLTIVLKRENLEAVKRRLDLLRNADSSAIESPQNSRSTKLEDQGSSFKCSKCSFACSSNSEFRSHVETQDCKTSEFTVASPLQHKLQCAVRELRAESPSTVKDPIKYSCTTCSGQFRTKAQLNSHMMLHLRGVSIQKCSKCTFQSTRRCLMKHIRESRHYSGLYHVRNVPKKTTEESKLPADVNIKPIETESTSGLLLPFNVCLNESNVSTTTTSDNATEPNKEPRKLIGDIKQECTSPVRPEAIYSQEEYADIAFERYDKEPLHDDDEDERQLMKCTLCSFVCKKAPMYKRHLDNHIRLSMPILKCQFCNFTGTKYGFRGHQSRCAGYRTSNCAWKPPQEILLTCSRCEFSSTLPGELNAHMQNCMGKKQV